MGNNEIKNIKGYTLVEVMVAMLIALIVLGGVFQTITRETLDMEEQEIILDMQNNARVAIDRMTREIRRAGFFGCGGDLVVNTLSNAGTVDTLVAGLTTAVAPLPGIAWNGNASILSTLRGMPSGTGVDYLGTPLAFNNNAPATHPLYDTGTDALSLAYLGGDVPLDPDTPMDAVDTNPLKLAAKAFVNGDIVYITDCKDYSLFQKTNTDHTFDLTHDVALLNNDESLGKAYGAKDQARVYNLKITTFFLEKGTNDLCYNVNDRAIASNIEDLQFEFMTSIGGAWAQTFDATKPEDVRAIRVWVLAMSDEVNDYTNKESYTYLGNTYTPNDNRYRYLASSVVYLRNAGI